MQTPQNPDDPHDAGIQRIPEMVGATSAPFALGKDATHISLAIHPPTGPAFLGVDKVPRRVFLKFENITSDEMAPPYNVFLNLPPGDDPAKHPELHVGVLAMFGLVELSSPSRDHPGDGLTYSVTVTSEFLRLPAMPGWDSNNLRITFVPKPWDDEVDVRVGRVSLYFE
jgi:hypothetical protein